MRIKIVHHQWYSYQRIPHHSVIIILKLGTPIEFVDVV